MSTRKRMRISDSQKDILVTRYNDLVDQGITDVYAALAEDPVVIKNGIVGDRHQIRYAVRKAKGEDDDEKENDDLLSMPNIFPNSTPSKIVDLIKEDDQLKKKQKTEKGPAKFVVVQDEFSNSELLDFFLEKVGSSLDIEISEFLLSQNIDGFTLNNYLNFKILKDEYKLKAGNAATIMKYQRRSSISDLRSEFEQNFNNELSPQEIRSRKQIPAREQLLSKANFSRHKREEKVGAAKLDIVYKDFNKNKKVVYTVKLPGQSNFETLTLAELGKFKDQVITWDRTHPEYGVIYPQDTVTAPKNKRRSRNSSTTTEITLEPSQEELDEFMDL